MFLHNFIELKRSEEWKDLPLQEVIDVLPIGFLKPRLSIFNPFAGKFSERDVRFRFAKNTDLVPIRKMTAVIERSERCLLQVSPTSRRSRKTRGAP